MALSTIVVGWEGPHTLESVRASDRGNGLYFLSGRKPYQKRDRIQYFGITSGLYRHRLDPRHHVLSQIKRNLRVWFGQVEFPRRVKRYHLELAEGCLIYYWGSGVNQKKLFSPPEPVCLISKWLKTDGEVRRNRFPIYRELPDVIWWDGKYWRTGNFETPYIDY